jgi:hypothetical protein
MPFSAVTCLSYTGTTPLGGIINLYSDVDSFASAFTTNINLSAITGNECPYYISNVPDGTTQIRIFDISTGCYCDIPIQSNDLCVSCDLDFNVYSASTIGRLVAGNLTGSCEANITDYRIYWYNTGDTTTPIFTSGKGTEYQPYSFTHPLTGSSAIFAPAGTYIPIIDKIKLSGLTFSQTGGTGNIPAELDCFTATTVTVDYFTCDNGDGSSDDANYEHKVQFSGAAAGVTPQSLFSDFLFTGTTDYFAWKFCGFDVEDRLRLIYSGSAYAEPILIEDMVIGGNLINTNFDLNKIPKSADTFGNAFYIKKVSCLTGLTRNINDTLRLEVIPNSANTQTNWDFYFTCLNSFDQNTCILTNKPFKISASTIDFTLDNDCNYISIFYKISGCSKNTDDFSKYLINDSSGSILNGANYVDTNTYTPNKILNVSTGFLRYNSPSSSFGTLKNTIPVCATPNPSNTISYSKYVSGGTGIIDMSFNNLSDFNAYYNSYNSVLTGSDSFADAICSGSSGSYSGTPFDPSNIKYYRYYGLVIPSNTGSTNCGDGTTQRSFRIHTSTVVTTGTSGTNYTLRITMPTIVNTITEPCFSGLAQNFVFQINDASTGTTNNFTGTTNVGSRYVDPFNIVETFCTGTTTFSATTSIGYVDYPKYLNETIPYTGTTPTIVPSLSAKTFNFDPADFIFNNSINNLGYYRKVNFSHEIKLRNPLDIRDFDIYAIYTGSTTFGNLLIYSYTGATSASTIHDPSYFI